MKPLDFNDRPRFSDRWNPYEIKRQNCRAWNVCGRIQSDLEGARVLDVGSRDGRMAYAAMHYGAAAVHGVDLYESNVRKSADLNRDNRSTFEQMHALPAVLRYGLRCDVVICAGLLYHLEEHRPMLKALTRCLDGRTKLIVLETAVQVGPERQEKVHPMGHRMVRPTVEVIEDTIGDDATLTELEWDESVFPLPFPDYPNHRKLWHLRK